MTINGCELEVDGYTYILPVFVKKMKLLGDRLLNMKFIDGVLTIVTNVKIYEFNKSEETLWWEY
jgi:hypothetical protein